MDLKTIDGNIAKIKTQGAKLDELITETSVGVLHHYAANGDVRVVNRFYLALSQGVRKAAMTAWMLNCMAVSANGDKATKAEQPFKFARDKATSIPKGEAKPWYEYKPEPKPDEMIDAKGLMQAMLNKIASAKAGVHQCSQEALDQCADAFGLKRIRLPASPSDKQEPVPQNGEVVLHAAEPAPAV